MDGADGGPPLQRYRPHAPHRFRSGGPLREVTVHRLRHPDHWHLVTYGLSELDAKESDDPALSGWGFELTFRLAANPAGAGGPAVGAGGPAVGAGGPGSGPGGPGASGPGGPAGRATRRPGARARGAGAAAPGADDAEPLWAVDLLTNLAAYVWSSGHAFSPGHHLDLRGPIRIDGGGDLTAAVIVIDPGLGVMRGPFGAVEFFQVVALTADELELCRAWSTSGVLEILARRDPLFVTDLGRRSILSDPATAGEVERAQLRLHGGDGPGAEHPRRRRGSGGATNGDGGSDGTDLARTDLAGVGLVGVGLAGVDEPGELRVGSLRWRSRPVGGTVAQLGAGAAAALGPALRRRLQREGDTFRVIGDNCEIRFVAAGAARWTADGARLELAVPLGEIEGLAALFDGRTGWGRRPDWPGLRWRVTP